MHRIDLSNDTPRDAVIPKLARHIHLGHRTSPKQWAFGPWSLRICHAGRVQIEESGTLIATGYLIVNQNIVPVRSPDQAGLLCQILTKPDEIFSRCLSQDIVAPENHGNQLLFSI